MIISRFKNFVRGFGKKSTKLFVVDHPVFFGYAEEKTASILVQIIKAEDPFYLTSHLHARAH